jgi:hypothetical protein
MKTVLQPTINKLTLLILFFFILQLQGFADGVKKVVVPTVTLSTEPLAAGNVMQGKYPGVVIYTLKVSAIVDPANVNWITFIPIGTFVPADISGYSLYWNTTNSFVGSTLSQSTNYGTGSGIAKTINAASTPVPVGQSRYFFIVADTSPTAVDGHNIKTAGAINLQTGDYPTFSASTVITNSQTDIAGIQTITAPKPIVSNEPIVVDNVLQGKNRHPFYVVKIEATTEDLVFNTLKLKTLGTYTNIDIPNFEILKGTTSTFASATYLGYHGQANTGNGQTLSLAGFTETIPMGEFRYYFFTANISASAVDGHTIRIDGSANPLQIVSSTTTPNPINNQTDVAGIQTITAPRPTIWTEPIATANVLQGKTNHPFYAIKIEATTETLVFDKLKIKTIGTYTASDLQIPLPQLHI